MNRLIQRALLTGMLCACCVRLAIGHETDQYTLPPHKDFANLADHFTQWAYETIDAAVIKVNARISQCAAQGRNPERMAELQSPEEIAKAVFAETTPAYFLIEGLEIELHSSAMAKRYPGQIVAYKEQFTNIYQHVHFFLDPRQFFRIWHASTVRINDTLVGTDKIGHFTDMGMNYYNAYSAALRKGQTKDEAWREAVGVGTHGLLFSERGAVGYLSAGAYSNADMVANYMGFKFYVNLTEPVRLNGRECPPMLVRDGDCWKIAPHVRPDSAFFTEYFSDHQNEAMNPSLFETAMRKSVRKALEERTDRILNRYVDANGNRRTQKEFADRIAETATYFGEEYGHEGAPDELVTIANTCFVPYPVTPDVSYRDQFGLTPLHDAAMRGDLVAVKQWLDRSIDVNVPLRSNEGYSPEWGDTPLHVAAFHDRAETARLLIERGANVSARNIRGATPLHMAVKHVDVVEALIAAGADVKAADYRGRTALHWAAAASADAAIPALVQAGGDLNARDFNGETPLFDAVRHGSLPTVSELLEYGADDHLANDLDSTCLHVACALRKDVIADRLLAAGADIDAADAFGWTALHDAARSGNPQVVALLLSKSAPVNAVDATGCTPLHLAARHGHVEAVRELIAGGANPIIRSESGSTALHDAAFGGDAEVVSMLFAKRVDPNARNAAGKTAYEIARDRGFQNAAALLRAPVPGATRTTK